MLPAREIYDLMLDKVHSAKGARIEEILIGLTWTLCRAQGDQVGLAMSPGIATRTLPWSGSLTGKMVSEIASWLTHWGPYESTIAMAAANAVINSDNGLIASAKPLPSKPGVGNLAVFEHFLPMLKDKKVAVVGRYPGFDQYQQQLDVKVLERNPGPGDLPDQACEVVLPEADWVFISASTIPNKTFPRLIELSAHANVVLMGPTVPWMEELGDMGVDYLAGAVVDNPEQLFSTVAEGGGVRIFGNGVSYHLADVSQRKMDSIKREISEIVAKRDHYKSEVEAWQSGRSVNPMPRLRELEQLDQRLSELDTQYKRLWDSRQQNVAFGA